MPHRKRVILVLATLVALVGCDQKTKSLARKHLRDSETRSFFADTLRLDYTENPGAFLSLGESLPAKWRYRIFTIGCSVAVVAVLLYALLSAQLGYLQVLALSMICAGGIGNLADRWLYGGYVRDFLNIGLGYVRTGVFNVADATLLSGCCVLFWTAGRSKSRVS